MQVDRKAEYLVDYRPSRTLSSSFLPPNMRTTASHDNFVRTSQTHFPLHLSMALSEKYTIRMRILGFEFIPVNERFCRGRDPKYCSTRLHNESRNSQTKPGSKR